MKLFKQSIFTLFLVTSIISCSDYLDVNNNPNSPLAEVVSPDLILAAAQNRSYNNIATTQNNYGTIMMNQWAGDVTNFTSGNSNEYRFNVTATFYSGIWSNQYFGTDKLQAIINKNSPEYVNYTAIAKVLKAHNMQYIVDLYGDAPYSEAFQRGANYQPAYDKAFDIYKAMFVELTEAISLINNATIEAVNPGANDVMLGGNMDMWKKFANTLRLKLLVRAASSTDGDVQAWVNTGYSSLGSTGFLGAGENIMNNPGYSVGNGTQNPFWNRYGDDADGNPTNTNKFVVGSQYFIEFLKANGVVTPIAFNDARISAFFSTAAGSGGDYQGIIQGADDPVNPNIGLSYLARGANKTLSSAAQSGLFFSASESFLLQAEAALNGKIGGSAQTFFENGITESFNYYALGASAAGYITATSGMAGIGWTGTDAEKLQAIMTQKWVALYSIDGAELIIEHNRTGYPNPPLPTLAGQTHRPYRLLYPDSELNGNTANVPTVTSAEVFAPAIFYQK